jgi:hypothetical protein
LMRADPLWLTPLDPLSLGRICLLVKVLDKVGTLLTLLQTISYSQETVALAPPLYRLPQEDLMTTVFLVAMLIPLKKRIYNVPSLTLSV